MKRFVAICLLVVCVALPLISWGATTYECLNCGSRNTKTTTDSRAKPTGSGTSHSESYYSVTTCSECNKLTISYGLHIVPHKYTKTVIDRMPSLNLKQVKYTCKPCGYSYTEYEPIDPSKPYGAIHN